MSYRELRLQVQELLSEEFTEQIARTLYAANPEIQPWNGDPFEFDEERAGRKREQARQVAEQVHQMLQAQFQTGQPYQPETQQEPAVATKVVERDLFSMFRAVGATPRDSVSTRALCDLMIKEEGLTFEGARDVIFDLIRDRRLELTPTYLLRIV